MTRAAPRTAERGLTLIELMVAMAIAGLLVAMILGVHTRMTAAFRGQSQVAGIDATLRGATTQLVADARMAGFMLPDGFRTAAFGDTNAIVSPLVVVNDDEGPDQLTIYYADADVSTRVTAIDPADRQGATVADSDGFEVGDLVVLTNPRQTGGSATKSAVVNYDACVVRVTGVAAARLEFGSSDDVNEATNAQCTAVANATGVEGVASETVAYRFQARHFRIDPDRPELGVLQRSSELEAGDWGDLALGVVNLQLATRYSEDGDAVDLDGDGDPEHDWYSGEGQEAVDATGERPVGAIPTELAVSVEARTRAEVRGVGTTTTPALTDDSDPPSSIIHNDLGDWASLDLATLADADRPVAYRGRHIFRATTTRVDLRNVGVGR